MATPNIVMARIDERLIHGQGQLWVKSLGCNTVIVANDKVSEDKIQQNGYSRFSSYAFLLFAESD